jgi:hypothetical protein
MEESINLAVRAAFVDKTIPEFTSRFKGLFDLQSKYEAGQQVIVPTVAEYVQSENDIADTLRSVGLGDLATQEYINDVLGAGNSVKTVTDKISNTFSRIDNASQAFKDAIAAQYPSVDRVSLAKAILAGPEGAAELQKKIEKTGVLTQAGMQGVTLQGTQAADIVAGGGTFENTASKFGAVATNTQGMGMLNQIYGSRYGQYGQNQAIAQQFGIGNVAEANKNQQMQLNAEQANFSGSAGNLQSAYGVTRTAYGTSPQGIV